MKDGICPKCGSQAIYSGVDVLMKGGMNRSNSIPITTFTLARLDNYVCGDCGFVESYIADSDKLERIIEEWPRVGEEEGTGW